MKNALFLLLLFFSSNLLNSQSSVNFGRTYSDTLPEDYLLDLTKTREHIFSKIPENISKKSYERAALKFSDYNALYLADKLASGDIYSDWKSLEDYVNQVLEKVTPEELKGDKNIKAYLVKDGNFNASMTPSGITFINIGLFDGVEDEATLASILVHELAHYHLKHSIKGFVKQNNGALRLGALFNKKKALSKFSIGNELQADSLAMHWLFESGYSMNGFESSFNQMMLIDSNLLLKTKDKIIEETTHPRSGKRLTKFKNFKKQYGDNEGGEFLISKAKFYQFKEQAKAEILKHLLDDFNFDLCIEKAFKYHLYDPNNSTYVYYLMEAIRRGAYINATKWKQNFITANYYEYFDTALGAENKELTKKHLFESFNNKILTMHEDEYDKIQAKFYWEGEVKFKTNEEAFDFFSRIGELLNEPECLLSNALSYSSNIKNRDILLKKYLSYDNIQYKEYAEGLLSGTLYSSLPDKKLTVLEDVLFMVKEGDDYIYLREKKSITSVDYMNKIQNNIEDDFNDRSFLILPDFKSNNISKYKQLKELAQLSYTPIVAKGSRTELHILNPKYWELMRSLNTNDIQFLNSKYVDVRKDDYSSYSYKKSIELNPLELLALEKRHRYYQVFVSSIRIKERGAMKIKYASDDEKLPYKKPIEDQLFKQVKSSLKAVDVISKKADNFVNLNKMGY